MSNAHVERRIPWIALALSLLSMGVGHVYSGRIAKGLVLYLAWFVVPAMGICAAMLPVSWVTLLVFLLLPGLSVLGLYVYGALDAFRSARRADPEYRLQDYNRASLYWLLILVQLACPTVMTFGMRELVFEAFYVPERSMSPTILGGDRILVNKFVARKRFPERGDLIVFRAPESAGGRVFVKRVIALSGDSLVMNGEGLEINGRQLQRDPIPGESLGAAGSHFDGDTYYEFNAGRRYTVGYGHSAAGRPSNDRFQLTVPENSVFVLGDNRDLSKDSRHFGAIPNGDVLGYVQYNYFPAATWQRFGTIGD